MTDHHFDKEKYLQRINLHKEIAPDFEDLQQLHRSQHTSIPFENFDIILGKKIEIDPQSVFQKLVMDQRGGYCFELNGLLYEALKSFGFKVRKLLGRVHVAGEPSGRSHQTTMVTIDGEHWLVDVGFGSECPLLPVPLNGECVSFEDQTYRIISDNVFGYMLQSKHVMEWKNLHSFDLNPVLDIDLKLGNYFTSTNPDSFFYTARIAALPIENGRLTLFNDRFKKVVAGKEEIVQLNNDTTYLSFLEENFGIKILADYNDLKPLT